jgi:hypothetical protein
MAKQVRLDEDVASLLVDHMELEGIPHAATAVNRALRLFFRGQSATAIAAVPPPPPISPAPKAPAPSPSSSAESDRLNKFFGGL